MPTRWRLEPQSVLFAIFLGALAALPPISIDMALPALVDISGALHASASQAGLTLSLFMAGFALGPIVYGPLSDARGRKPTLLLGLVLFTVGGIVSALAPGMSVLLVARLVQGIGAGAGMTVALAIVRDLFEGNAMQHRLAAITVVANVAPIVAPSIGVGLLAAIEWRGIYGVMAACGLLAAFDGLRTPTRRRYDVNVRAIVIKTRRISCNRGGRPIRRFHCQNGAHKNLLRFASFLSIRVNTVRDEALNRYSRHRTPRHRKLTIKGLTAMKKQLVAASLAALFSAAVFAQASAPAMAPAAPAATANAAQPASTTHKAKKHHKKHHKHPAAAASTTPSSAAKP